MDVWSVATEIDVSVSVVCDWLTYSKSHAHAVLNVLSRRARALKYLCERHTHAHTLAPVYAHNARAFSTPPSGLMLLMARPNQRHQVHAHTQPNWQKKTNPPNCRLVSGRNRVCGRCRPMSNGAARASSSADGGGGGGVRAHTYVVPFSQ